MMGSDQRFGEERLALFVSASLIHTSSSICFVVRTKVLIALVCSGARST